MTTRFDRSGVPQPDVAVHVFDENWRPQDNYSPAVSEEIGSVFDIDPELRLIGRIAVAKPVWFSSMEADSREFLGKNGFHNLPPVFLLPECPELEDLNMSPSENAYAQTDYLHRFALVRRSKLQEVRQYDGRDKAASVLVHELAHLTLRHVSLSFRQDEFAGIKAGFVYEDQTKKRGFFLEEAFAAYLGGQYVLHKITGRRLPYSFIGEPQPYIPEHYRFMDEGHARFGSTGTMGPDGYALEMLMWGAEQRGIMEAQTFWGNMRAIRNKTSQAYGMRHIIRAINAIQPGLYDMLSHLEYNRENWQDGCALVYEAVTGNFWPEANNLTV